jgi:hypothetical protein
MSYNLKTELEAAEAEAGELVFAIVVGRHDRDAYYHKSPTAYENVVLSREDGLALLDQDYDNGYGGADCRPFYAYSQNRIYFVSEYDGATGLGWMPRHPVDCKPSFQ